MDKRIAFAALALGLVACGAEDQRQGIAFSVKKGDLVYGRSFYGELVARKSIAIHTPELSGIYQLTVEKLSADGTKVKKGDVVLTFATGLIRGELTDQEAELGVARAELRKVQSDLAREKIELSLAVKRARLDVERAKLNVIVGVNLISKVELDKAKIGLDQAKLALQLAKKALRTFAKKRASAIEVQTLKVKAIEEKVNEKRTQLASATLHAPAAGVLYAPYTRLNWVRGKAAPGSVTRPGDKILEIPDLSAFDVALYVRQRDATLLSVGDKAVVVPTVLPDERIEAEVVSKDSFAATRNERLGTRESQGNLKEVKVLLRLAKNFPQLRPGGTVRADVRSIMSNAGPALMGTGWGEGEGRAIAAAQEAISSPLLEDVGVDGAQGILLNITGGPDLKLVEVSQAAELIEDAAHEDVNLIFGQVTDPEMHERVKVTVIATGFEPAEPQEQRIEQAAAEARRSRPSQIGSPYRPQKTERPLARALNQRPQQQEQAQATVASTGRQSSMFSEAEIDIPTFIRKQTE